MRHQLSPRELEEQQRKANEEGLNEIHRQFQTKEVR
jgi:hypothetical protein